MHGFEKNISKGYIKNSRIKCDMEQQLYATTSFISQKYSVIEYSFHLLHKPSQIRDEAGDNQEILLFGVIIFLS
jgi:hypothetical protein